MEWATPQFARPDVDRAGRDLVSAPFPPQDDHTLSVLNNWRASHSYPLNNFQTNLRSKVRNIELGNAIVAQRIKRLESIYAKLSRHPTMRLSQMQDIGGCRAVMKNMRNVRKLIQRYEGSSLRHKLTGEKDYIANPKHDGYRSHHLIYEYAGRGNKDCYSGLKIEIQIRSEMQHAWATAVEAVGIFTHQALKSNQGSEDWKRFFALMGSVIAALEECETVPGAPTDKNVLVLELNALIQLLNIREVLSYYNTTIQYVNTIKDAKYFIVRMDFDGRSINVERFKAQESKLANTKYIQMESQIKKGANVQVVLVSVDSLTALKRAYPNYFLDTSRFASLVEVGSAGRFPDPLTP